MKVLVLMSGTSKFFKEAGYYYPKNLIEIENKPLIQRVLESLEGIFFECTEVLVTISKQENDTNFTGKVAQLVVPKCKIIETSERTAGAACSALLAIDHINPNEPLLIINGDQIIDYDLAPALSFFKNQTLDGGIVIFNSVHPRWSYVKLDEQDFVIEAAEKRPLSHHATAGFYYFQKGQFFIESAFSMITKGTTFDGKFYICPAYNELILKSLKIKTYQIPTNNYHSLATPQDVKSYEEYLKRIQKS